MPIKDPIEGLHVKKNKKYEFDDDSAMSLKDAHSLSNFKDESKKNGYYKEMRVSLSKNTLVKNLLELFKEQSEYKLNDLVEISHHPVAPLKETLHELGDYDTKRRVWSLKETYKSSY